MWVNNLLKVATQWNNGATLDSKRGPQARISSELTTRPLSHSGVYNVWTHSLKRACRTSHSRTNEQSIAAVEVDDVRCKDGQQEAKTDRQTTDDNDSPTAEAHSQHVRYRTWAHIDTDSWLASLKLMSDQR